MAVFKISEWDNLYGNLLALSPPTIHQYKYDVSTNVWELVSTADVTVGQYDTIYYTIKRSTNPNKFQWEIGNKVTLFENVDVSYTSANKKFGFIEKATWNNIYGELSSYPKYYNISQWEDSSSSVGTLVKKFEGTIFFNVYNTTHYFVRRQVSPGINQWSDGDRISVIS